jgi:pyruvate-formate lyase-activating enzyme
MMFICRQQNLRTYLETNGTLPRQLEEVIGLTDIVAMDFKFPSSGGGRDYWFAHREFLGIASRALVFVKAVVCSQTQEEDLDTAIEIIREVNRETVLVFQPNSYQLAQGLSGKLLRFKEKCLKHKVLSCVIPQMHKKWGVR